MTDIFERWILECQTGETFEEWMESEAAREQRIEAFKRVLATPEGRVAVASVAVMAMTTRRLGSQHRGIPPGMLSKIIGAALGATGIGAPAAAAFIAVGGNLRGALKGSKGPNAPK